jgi:hypothetical protein
MFLEAGEGRRYTARVAVSRRCKRSIHGAEVCLTSTDCTSPRGGCRDISGAYMINVFVPVVLSGKILPRHDRLMCRSDPRSTIVRERDKTGGSHVNIDEWLVQSAAELAEAEADLHAAELRVAELRTIREGIQLAQQRYGQEDRSASSAAQSRPTKAASGGGRKTTRRKTPAKRAPQRGHSDLCYKVLTATTEKQLDQATAREMLAEQGHELDAEQVRNGFAYLVRKGQAIRVETGVYALNPSSPLNQVATQREAEPDVTADSSV